MQALTVLKWSLMVLSIMFAGTQIGGRLICWIAISCGCGISEAETPTTFQRQPNLIVLQGPIDDTRAEQFQNALKGTGKNGRLIELASMGGLTGPGERIAALIKNSGLPVRVSLLCGSFCVRLFVSVPKERRLTTPDAMFWFHYGKQSATNPSCSVCAKIEPILITNDASFNPKLMLEWAQEISPNLPRYLEACDAFASSDGLALTWQEIENIDGGLAGPSCDLLRSRGSNWVMAVAKTRSLAPVPRELSGGS